uniref:FYVE-type domain-containing protein n=1 Tax=Ascaris lumbricoides TaxID=6252 RepID=A0A0M3IMT1_ASCLU
MDIVPDMDALLDQLEASEDATQSNHNQSFIRTNNKENIIKPEKKFLIPFDSQISTINTAKRTDQEDTNNDSSKQLSHLRNISNNSELSLVDEDHSDAHLMRATRKEDDKPGENEANHPGVSSSSLKGPELAVSNANSEEPTEDVDEAICSVKERSEIASSSRIVGDMEGVEITTAGDGDLTRHLCDLPEADQSPAAAANELDQMAREFEEMDQYLARCAIESGELKVSLSTGEKDLGSLNIEPAASGSRSDETNPTVKDDSKDGSLEPSEGRMENVDLSIASVRFDNTPVADDGDNKTEVPSIDTKINKEENETTVGKEFIPTGFKEMTQAVQMMHNEDVDVVVEGNFLLPFYLK